MAGASHWLHSSFYRFTPVADPAAVAEAVRALARELTGAITLAQGVTGAITLAPEGLSGAVAGTPAAVQAFETALVGSPVFGGALQGLVFKHSHGHTAPYARLKVNTKPELVALGLPGADALPPPDEEDDSHLSPAQWRALLDEGRAVVLDNRNHFEWRLGRFRGAVDPQVPNFRDFRAWVLAQAPAWRAEGRPVAMYCTGGIRCDKTAPWLRSLGLQVRQLQGGILGYFEALPDAARDWQGECFVFDNRIALDTQLQQTATGPAQVYDPTQPDEAWRLQRARRLQAAAGDA
ncbi:rhodanese-like domain-containing protein [uncultured Aquincola sp.]|uniref:oxygen-dependent tRNA uridine(34) hydroxylase TrhO n=1 Tax=uncultured Aquincola sp. TaxID=886556 RepID=UPI0032B30350